MLRKYEYVIINQSQIQLKIENGRILGLEIL